MKTYGDTGVLVKRYVLEANSVSAIAWIDAAGPSIAFSHFHAVEIPNAIRLKRFRDELTAAQESAALRAFEDDVTAGRLARPVYDLAAAFRRAASLPARHSSRRGTRSMDILHVAAALEIGCREFISLDARQRQIAREEKLLLIPAEMPKETR